MFFPVGLCNLVVQNSHGPAVSPQRFEQGSHAWDSELWDGRVTVWFCCCLACLPQVVTEDQLG